MNQESTTSDKLPWALGAAVSLAYLSMPSAHFNFDGVACAIAVELGDVNRLAHGNHVAYGLLGLVFDRLWRLLGFTGPAIFTLQIMDSLLGGLGVALFMRLLQRRLQVERMRALLASICLAVSYGWWFWSLEAQVYVLGNVFAILAADAALGGKARATGLWGAGAVLGHVGHLMLFPFLLLKVKDRKSCLLYAAGGIAAGYAVGAACVSPSNFGELRLWLLGSAALKVGGEFTWYTGSFFSNIKDWFFMTFRVFSDGPLWWLFGGTAVTAALWGLRSRKDLGLWFAGYALLFVSWQPFTLVYRVGDLAPLWALAAAARPPLWALGLWAAGAFLYNGGVLIRPKLDPANNAELQQALALKKTTPENAWIITSGLGQVYVPYFGHRKPLNLRYYEEPGALEARIAALEAAGEPVYGMNGQPSGSRKKKANTAPADKKGPKGMGSERLSRPRKISDKP
jgi:hypothetical protein